MRPLVAAVPQLVVHHRPLDVDHRVPNEVRPVPFDVPRAVRPPPPEEAPVAAPFALPPPRPEKARRYRLLQLRRRFTDEWIEPPYEQEARLLLHWP